MNRISHTLKQTVRRGAVTLSCAGLMLLQSTPAHSAPLNIGDTPLFLNGTVAPLNMLVMGRDHKLYYEAYNDASDLNGDGTIDVGYRPAEIDYFGYFDSYKCYTYSSSNGRFNPASVTATKKCSGQWSGDFLNYVTTARIDALRKVLYGGRRFQDDSTTILERSHIPQDAHSWGKEYESIARDGYDISQYTPYAVPVPGTRHLFANTTLLTSGSGEPRLRVLLNRVQRIWEWVSIERPVAGNQVLDPVTGTRLSVTPTDFYVRVRVCLASMPESNCRVYPSGDLKPTGLLQDFGENDSMMFGLLSGSYERNTSGGVLRKNVGSITDEINATNGRFTGTVGIIKSIDRLQTIGFTNSPSSYTHNYNCGWITTRPINSGECRMWGNPTGEMMYETLRYFAGQGSPTPGFNIASSGNDDAALGLPLASWQDPYASAPTCAKPFQTVISDINPSYDTNEVPGSAFSGFAGDMAGLDAAAIGQEIWNYEMGGASSHFIGESAGIFDGAPTPKTVTSFGTIRGLSPEEPAKEGGYYSASVARYGLQTDVNGADGDQNVSTFAVALASPLPRIEIPVGGGRVTLVPFAKSVGGCLSVNGTQGLYQPTNSIVDFYVETIAPTSGRFRVNFEDVEQGADHDMDAIAIYDYTVNADNTVTVNMTSAYAAGCIIQHMGYVISGTTADGTYLEIRDLDTGSSSDPDYFLDTPPGQLPAAAPNDGTALPLSSTRTFTPGPTPGATLLTDPLWYAAKWGGFQDSNDDGLPDIQSEWDEDGDGNPDNYFLVTNALTLGSQLASAFDEIIDRVASASSASVNSGSISSETRVYQAKFNSGTWTGQLLSFPVNADGTLGAEEWDAGAQVPLAGSRKVLTINGAGTGIPFRWLSLDAAQRTALQPASDGLGDERLDYLRGDGALEGTTFRDRASKLGDIVASSPIFVGAPPFFYPDALETAPYSAFRTAQVNRKKMVYAGANDGMLHGFDAQTGVEELAYVPGEVFGNLQLLSSPAYQHRYFVDGPPNMGDAFFDGAWHTVLVGGLNKGGNGIYALDITDPSSFSESNAASIVMWEFTDSNDADLGYSYSQPAVVRLKNGKWAAVFGNGYNSTVADGNASATGNAVLYIVDVETGSLIRKLSTLTGTAQDPTGSGRPNGLATPAVVDFNADYVADYVFAGDLFGNLWKFDIRNADPAQWKVAYDSGGTPLPLYQARDGGGTAQPITSRPEVGRGPGGAGMIVLFGTGKYLELNDKNVAFLDTQSFYGIVDRNSGTSTDIVAGRAQLQQQQITHEFSESFGGNLIGVRVTTNNSATGFRGWYLDLLLPVNGFEGEMQVSNSILRNGRIVFTTVIPDQDVCSFGGSSWLMELDALTGSRLATTPFDLNNDGKFDPQDYVTVPDGTDLTVPVSGIESQVGIMPTPGVLAADDVEFKYTPGTTGNIQITTENPGVGGFGRQSWRQIR